MRNIWEERIATLVLVKQELAKIDKDNLWPYFLPSVAVAEEEIKRVEGILGYILDNDYRTFLQKANGWKGFFQEVDLFGTAQLVGSDMEYAQMMLNSIDDSVWKNSRLKKEDVLPVAATKFDKDIFVITKPTAMNPGIVIWLAGEEIDRFSSFSEYFLAMIDYNRLLITNYTK